MATTVASIQTKINQFIRDTTTNSVSAADRLSAISMITQDMMTEYGLDLQTSSYTLSAYADIHYYNITTAVAGFMDVVDLRRQTPNQTEQFTRKTARELALEIDLEMSQDPSFAIERRDGSTYMVVNFQTQFSAIPANDCDSLTANGTWAVDATNSDATNLTEDSNEFKQGSGSLNFDITVAQSGNNRATVSNSTMNSLDLSDLLDLGAITFWIYVPTVTNFTSVTAYWGSSSSAYWSATATTDYLGNAFVAGWNRVLILWNGSTMTSTPDESAIDYLRIDFNYGAGQADDTDYRVDDIKFVRPEKLDFLYQSRYIGASSGGTKLFAYTATSDVPYYSGQYDYLDNVVAHGAAGILFRQMNLIYEASEEEAQYSKLLKETRDRFPANRLTELSNFKVKGVNFARNSRRNWK